MRFRDVANKKELEAIRDDFITQGYTVKEEGQSQTLMKKKSWGSAAGLIVTIGLAFLLSIPTILLSFLIPLVYVIYAHYTAPEVLIRIQAA